MPALMLWAQYAVPILVLAVLGPIIYERASGRAFTLFAVAMWAIATAIMEWPGVMAQGVDTYRQLWATRSGEAAAGLAAVALGYGLPILGAAICIWVLRRYDTVRWGQALGALVVAAVLCPFAPMISYFMAPALAELASKIH